MFHTVRLCSVYFTFKIRRLLALKHENCHLFHSQLHVLSTSNFLLHAFVRSFNVCASSIPKNTCSAVVYRVPCTVYSYSNGDSSPNYFGEIGLTIWNSNLINQGVMFKHRALDQFLVKHGSSNGGGFLVVLYGYLQLWQMFTQEDTVCRENQFQKGGTCAHSNPFSITTKIIRRINLK